MMSEVITLNEKEYVEKGEYDKVVEELQKLKKEEKSDGISIPKPVLVDKEGVVGFGQVECGSEYHVVKLSYFLVEKAVDILKALDPDDSTMVFGIAKNLPLVIGKQGEDDKRKVCGLVIAPKEGKDEC